MIRTVFGHNKSGTALIPIFDTLSMSMNISTRVGNIILNKGDGSADIAFTPVKNNDFTVTGFETPFFTYSTAFTGSFSIKLLKGLKDVYSIWIGKGHIGNNDSKLNITDVETFFSQFPNLYSLSISESAAQTTSKMSVIKGDLAKFPNSVEKVLIDSAEVIGISSGELYLNFSSYTNASQLKSFSFNPANNTLYGLKIIGDLGKLPTTCQKLYIANNRVFAGSAITYTAGKVWASSFDTLYLPIRLKISETNNIFIDANNSVTTAIGGKSWTLQGVRTIVSDTAVSGLISKGFAINCKKLASTLILDDPTNLLNDSYARYIELVGNPYDSDLFKTSTGNYGYMPNSTDLDFGTGSLRFGCTVKFSAVTGLKGIIGKTIAAATVGRYGIYFDSGNLIAISQITSGNVLNSTPISTYNDGNFHTIEVICNRTTGKQTLTIDGVLINTTSFTPSSDNLAVNAGFMIGAYGNSTGTGLLASSELNGIIKDVFVNKF